jgi:hypothetical protein
MVYAPGATGGNYVIIPAGPAYDGTTPAANGVDLSTMTYTSSSSASWDDASIVMTLPVTAFPNGFPFAGGSTTDITVNSNGKVMLGNTIDPSFATNGSNWGSTSPFQGLTGSGLAVMSPYNTDLDPAAGGQIWYEDPSPSGGVRITWHNVPCWPVVPGIVNDIQIELLPGGLVQIAYGGGLDNGTNDLIVGFSAGGGQPMSQPIDWSALNGYVTGTGEVALSMASDARPILGTTVNMTVDNIPGGSPLAAIIYGLNQLNPGVDLTGIGMPGCFQYCSQDAVVLAIGPGASFSNAFAVPAGITFSGLVVNVQGGAYNPSAIANTLGAISSNGVELKLDVN